MSGAVSRTKYAVKWPIFLLTNPQQTHKIYINIFFIIFRYLSSIIGMWPFADTDVPAPSGYNFWKTPSPQMTDNFWNSVEPEQMTYNFWSGYVRVDLWVPLMGKYFNHINFKQLFQQSSTYVYRSTQQWFAVKSQAYTLKGRINLNLSHYQMNAVAVYWQLAKLFCISVLTLNAIN